jgi:hypothetical protein
MADSVPGSISRAHPNTFWLIYFPPWTQDEAAFVDASIGQICCNHPTISPGFPFAHMKNLLSISYKGVLSIDESNPPTISKPPMIEDQLDNNNKISAKSSPKGSNKFKRQ